MTMYATLEEAIDAAREEFLADNPDLDADDASVQQLNVQKYVLQDGDIMWQAEFFADEDEEGECLPMLSGEAAQSVFDGDYDEIPPMLMQPYIENAILHGLNPKETSFIQLQILHRTLCAICIFVDY